MLNPKVVTDNSVYPSTAVIQIIIRKYDQDGVFPLLSLNQHSITSEELEGFHSVI